MAASDLSPTPIEGERLDLEGMEDQRLLMESLGRLAMGVQPLSQWAPVFSNPKLMHLPGLRCKAFTVWFPTMLEFVGQGVGELAQLRNEVEERDLDHEGLFDVADEAERGIRGVLSLYTKEAQLFINDRRLQNVHGIVSQFFRPTVGVKWYDADDRVVYRDRMPDDQYHEIMRAFYADIQGSTLALLERCVTREEWVELGQLAQGQASIEDLTHLADRLGVGTEVE